MASNDGLGPLTREELNDWGPEELRQLVVDMLDDWDTVNNILNRQATAFGWCGEYEERMHSYNAETKVLKMTGRTPAGTPISVRNAYAARRLVMGHVISTLERFGLNVPDGCWSGVVRDHQQLSDVHAELVERLAAEKLATSTSEETTK